MNNLPPGVLPILFGLFLLLAVFLAPTTTRNEDLFNSLDYLSTVLSELMNKHPRFREFHQKSVPILLNDTRNIFEKKAQLLTLLKDIKPFSNPVKDTRDLDVVFEAQETVDRMMKNHNFSEQICISKYFHDDEEKGLDFYRKYWILFAEDRYLDSTAQEKKLMIKALIVEFLGEDKDK